MRAKKGVVFLGIFAIFISLIVFAQPVPPPNTQPNQPTPSTNTQTSQTTQARDYACEDSQAIIKLSLLTNAHGAIFRNQDYNKKICYDEIFGKEYTFPIQTNPHDCTNTNKVLSLSADNNAHAQTDSSQNILYVNPYNRICYGDLECTTRTKFVGCEADEKLIVSLSSTSNAHLAYDNSYNFLICCSSAFAEGVIGNCDRDNTCEVGETCNCIDCGGGTPTPPDTCTNGLICDTDSNICEELNTPECPLGQTLCSDNICRTQCDPPLTDICNYNNGLCGVDNNNKIESCDCSDCYGFADSCGVNNGNQLACDFRTNTCQSCPEGNVRDGKCERDPTPEILIKDPERKDNVEDFLKFKQGSEISFNQDILNKNKLLRDVNISWNFGDEIKAFGGCLTGTNCNTTKTYANNGYKAASATALERAKSGSGNLRSDIDYTEFLVYKEGLNLFSIITKPEIGSRIESGKPIQFDASKSFVAECSGTESICENSTNAGSVSSTTACYSVGNLWCYDYPRPDQGSVYTNFGEYEFIFKWTLNSESSQLESIEGNWKEDFNEVVKFTKKLEGNPGTNYTVSLITKYRYNP